MDDIDAVTRLDLVVPGVQAQALRLAECTVLPLQWTAFLVRQFASRHGLMADRVYELAIAEAGGYWPVSASAAIANEAAHLLAFALP